MSLACSPQGLYAGLVNGSVASYTKAPGNFPLSVLTLARSQSPLPRCLSLLVANLCDLLLTHKALMGTWDVFLSWFPGISCSTVTRIRAGQP